MEIEKYKEFAKEKLGFEFNDINLLVLALTHRSYVNEHKSVHEHNERLEFLVTRCLSWCRLISCTVIMSILRV